MGGGRPRLSWGRVAMEMILKVPLTRLGFADPPSPRWGEE